MLRLLVILFPVQAAGNNHDYSETGSFLRPSIEVEDEISVGRKRATAALRADYPLRRRHHGIGAMRGSHVRYVRGRDAIVRVESRP